MEKSCNSPVTSLTIVRISLGLFYILFGAMKLFMMWPDMVAGMMTGIYWLEWIYASLLAWAVMLTEFVWGIFILLWSKIPKILYKLTLIWFVSIPVVWFLSVWINDEANMLKELFFHLQVTMVALALLFSDPKCGFWITWNKD